MSYLTSYDFQRLIQDSALQQVIGNNSAVLDSIILAAEAEVKSYLVQRFDISGEFKPTLVYSPAITYKANDRVILAAATYAPTTTYSINNLTSYNGNIYIATGTTTGVFDQSKWTLLGLVGQMFFVTYPAQPFDYSAMYKVGDVVFWKDKIYTCKIATPILDHDTTLQYNRKENLPFLNVTPDDSQNGLIYWGSGVTYSVTGVLPTDTTKWTAGDNRDQQIVLYLTDITLFHVHSRLAPRNIPELRQDRYHNAIDWLKMVATGAVTPALPLLQPKQGGRIRFGGSIRQINSF